jgi:hypothetical protein
MAKHGDARGWGGGGGGTVRLRDFLCQLYTRKLAGLGYIADTKSWGPLAR